MCQRSYGQIHMARDAALFFDFFGKSRVGYIRGGRGA